jgi:hypothetical protein
MICQKCGKRDFDTSAGCLNPQIISPGVGDWLCHENGNDLDTSHVKPTITTVVNVEVFFLVWCPSGHKPPSYKHPTFEKAFKEAQRLSNLNPGCEFFVLGCAGCASTQKTYQIVRNDDDIPF